MPLCFGAAGSVRASNAPQSARCAEEVHTFWPLIRHPPSTRVALVLSDARSDPAPGSEKSWHQPISPRSVGSANCLRCSSDPAASTVGRIHCAIPSDGRTRNGRLSNSSSMMSCWAGDGVQTPRRREMRCDQTRFGQRGALRAGPELRILRILPTRGVVAQRGGMRRAPRRPGPGIPARRRTVRWRSRGRVRRGRPADAPIRVAGPTAAARLMARFQYRCRSCSQV